MILGRSPGVARHRGIFFYSISLRSTPGEISLHDRATMIYLAPILGITDSLFRTVYARHFKGVDRAVAPFISLVEGKKIKPRLLRDLLPSDNQAMPVIPQVLGHKPLQFLVMAQALAELGYGSLNWNLGCPMRNVARKVRGAGLLPFPDIIEETLEAIIPGLNMGLSVKLRLGYHNKEEIHDVVKVLNRYPLDFVVVHPRTGVQGYGGKVDLEAFEKTKERLVHPVIYNGDITDVEKFTLLRNRFDVTGWMVGRGLLYDLFLPVRMKGESVGSPREQLLRTFSFHWDLIEGIRRREGTERAKLNKIKEYWGFFHSMYQGGDSFYDLLKVENDLKSAERLLGSFMKNTGLVR